MTLHRPKCPVTLESTLARKNCTFASLSVDTQNQVDDMPHKHSHQGERHNRSRRQNTPEKCHIHTIAPAKRMRNRISPTTIPRSRRLRGRNGAPAVIESEKTMQAATRIENQLNLIRWVVYCKDAATKRLKHARARSDEDSNYENSILRTRCFAPLNTCLRS